MAWKYLLKVNIKTTVLIIEYNSFDYNFLFISTSIKYAVVEIIN